MKLSAASLLFLFAVLPAYSATQVTVAQLEKTVAAGRTLPDDKLAGELAELELTQRLSASAQVQLQSGLPGPQSQQELSILAAQSSFLDLPPGELPATPEPNVAQQRQIMAQVVTYVTQTVKKLPDFVATRETSTFQDRPAGAYSYEPLHFTGKSSVNVVYRDGQERDTNSKGKRVDTAAAGLVSWGEFGPILTTVLLDAAKSQLAWSHWEQDPSGPVAVFHYSVPAKASHYQIQYCCVANPSIASDGPEVFRKQAPYHGEMAVDPSTGAIYRVTVIANLDPDDPLAFAAIAVQYRQIDIGGKTYICPVRSEALALRHQSDVTSDAIAGASGAIPSTAVRSAPLWIRLNEVTFSNYHIYRGESRILTDAEVAQMTGQPAPPEDPNPPAPSPEPDAAPAKGSASASQPAQPAPDAESASNPQPSREAAPKPGTQSQPAESESAASPSAPANPANTANAASSSNPATSAVSPDVPVFRTTARQVLVDVIVGKKNGDPVPGLPQSDFTVAENGRLQNIDFFEEHAAGASSPVAAPEMPPLPPGTVTNVPTTPPSASLYVFLLDSLNTEPEDQVYVRQQVLAYLRKMDPGTQVAVFSLGSSLRLLQGFSADPEALLAAVSRNEAGREAMAQTRSDNADDAQHTANLSAMRSTAPGLSQYAKGNTPQGYSFGARASMTFEAVNALARYLEGVPGRKNLIWFASSFPVVFFPTTKQMEDIRKNPELAGYANHVKQTADLLTLSKVAVYPVSGSGVMNSNIGMADSAGAGSAGGTGHFGSNENMTSSLTGEAINSASALTGMEQLASSTGGRAFTTNDINDAVRKIVHDSDFYYTVGYAPTDTTEDGRFRRIDLKVSGGKYKLSYRKGYNASEPGAAPTENPITPLLQYGLPNATGILYGAGVTAITNHDSTPAGQNPALKGPLARYAVSFTIRAQDVSFTQAPNGDRIAKLLIGLKAYGKDGAALNWQASREAAELSPIQYASILKSGIPVTLNIDLPATSSARLVTAVYDWNTGRSGTLEIPLQP